MTHLTEEGMYNFVASNPHLVTSKVQLNGLRVLKYKNKVFYKDLWTPEICECRGTVVDDSEPGKLKVIQRPFTKIFNLHERGRRIHRDTIVTAPRKINGFMAALTWWNDQPLVSTTGSCDSDFADMATAMLAETDAFNMAREFNGGVTWLFEIVHPNDPHIYPEEIGCYLIGARRTEWDAKQHFLHEYQLDRIAEGTGLMRPEWFRMPFGQVVQMNKRVDHEGFVCWTDDGYELKLKSPRYLTSKFLARIRGDKLVEAIETDPDKLKLRIDEEFFPLVDHIVAHKDTFAEAEEQHRLQMIREFIDCELTE